MRRLRPGPHRPRIPDRGAEGREEGAQGVAAEEALRDVDEGGSRKLVNRCSCALGQSPGKVGFHDLTAISASFRQDSS